MRQQRPENGTNLGVTRQVKGAAQPSWFPFTQEEPGSIKRDFSTSHVWSYFTLLRPQQAGLQHHIYRVGSKARTGPEATARRRQDSHPALQQPSSWNPESLASDPSMLNRHWRCSAPLSKAAEHGGSWWLLTFDADTQTLLAQVGKAATSSGHTQHHNRTCS